MIETRTFGRTAAGEEVLAFTLGDEVGKAIILNYGGTLQSLIVPDRAGCPTDVVLGYDTVLEYQRNGGYLGALIGRFGNRIERGRLELDGARYQLYCNDRGNHLHGGKRGFDKQIWRHEIVGEELRLSLFSPDGEENYPGNLSVEVIYTFSKGELKIRYRAVSDKKTAVNLTNHAYFNLDGAGKGDVLRQQLKIESDDIVPTDETMIPVGGFRAVKGTPFDFNELKEIGKDIGANDEDLLRGNGYDHCYLLRKARGEYGKFAEARSAKTGIVMHCFTDMPAVQFYSGNGLNQKGKGGTYGKRAGFCLETQAIPNNVNVAEYAEKGSSVLGAGEKYESSSAYRFQVGS